MSLHSMKKKNNSERISWKPSWFILLIHVGPIRISESFAVFVNFMIEILKSKLLIQPNSFLFSTWVSWMLWPVNGPEIIRDSMLGANLKASLVLFYVFFFYSTFMDSSNLLDPLCSFHSISGSYDSLLTTVINVLIPAPFHTRQKEIILSGSFTKANTVNNSCITWR